MIERNWRRTLLPGVSVMLTPRRGGAVILLTLNDLRELLSEVEVSGLLPGDRDAVGQADAPEMVNDFKSDEQGGD